MENTETAEISEVLTALRADTTLEPTAKKRLARLLKEISVLPEGTVSDDLRKRVADFYKSREALLRASKPAPVTT